MTNTYNCVLLGDEGSGKSSLGNYVAGENSINNDVDENKENLDVN